eukprot:6202265-Pleurochrysis_carterae.AAC.1
MAGPWRPYVLVDWTHRLDQMTNRMTRTRSPTLYKNERLDETVQHNDDLVWTPQGLPFQLYTKDSLC